MLHCATTSDKVSLSTPVKFSFYLILPQATAKRDSMTPFTSLFFKPFVSATERKSHEARRDRRNAALKCNVHLLVFDFARAIAKTKSWNFKFDMTASLKFSFLLILSHAIAKKLQ